MKDETTATHYESQTARNQALNQSMTRGNPMKRYFSLGLMALAFVAASLFMAAPAMATTVTQNGVTCTTYSDSSGKWPAVAGQNKYWYCGYRTNKSIVVMNSLSSMVTGTTTTLGNAGTQVYVFAYVQDADAFFNTTEQKEQDAAGIAYGGWTDYTNNRLVILEGQKSGAVVVYLSDTTNAATSHHEAGHMLDVLWGGIVGRSWVSQLGGNQQQSYTGFVSHDWRNLTYQAPGYTTLKPPCGGSTIFNGQTDPRNGLAICVGSSINPAETDLIGLNNQQILQKILPYNFSTYDTSGQYWRELWPQQFATVSGTSGTQPADYYLQNFFPCSKAYSSYLYQHQSLQPLTGYGAECKN